MNYSTFINSFPFPSLAEAVIKQSGGWDSFQEDAPDIASHGASGGFNGFIYYRNTIEFYDDNRVSILRAFQDQCIEFGEPMAQALARFNCLDCSDAQAESFLIGLNDDGQTDFKNALSWWSLEYVAGQFETLS